MPPRVRPLTDAYLAALTPVRDRVHGIYVHGSVALGAFEDGPSDVDAVVVTDGIWTDRDLAELARLHRRLNRASPLARRLDLASVPLHDLGKGNAEIAPYPVARDGRFRPAGRGDLNAVTWWLVAHRGIPLLGPPPASLPLDVAWEDVRLAMRDNLDGYWAGKAAHPHVFLTDFWVGFAVATLCRILTTLDDGEIVAKTEAIDRWRGRLPERWHPLVDEARRLRQEPRLPSRYPSRLRRMREAVAFVAFAREQGRRSFPDGLTRDRRPYQVERRR